MPWQIICMTASADTAILFWFFCVPHVTNSLLCDCILMFIFIRMTSFLSWNEYNTLNIFNIFCMYVFSSFCIYLIFVIFWVCVYWSYYCQLYFMFCISAFISFHKISSKACTWNPSTLIIYHCGILCQCMSLYKFHDPSWDFWSVTAYLFLLSWQCL